MVLDLLGATVALMGHSCQRAALATSTARAAMGHSQGCHEAGAGLGSLVTGFHS